MNEAPMLDRRSLPCGHACVAANKCGLAGECAYPNEGAPVRAFDYFRLEAKYLTLIEDAARACEKVRDDNFIVYTDTERLVCECCARAIRALKEPQS